MADDVIASDDTLRSFLTALHQQTTTAGAPQASMFDVGEAVGMSRPDAQRAAETLIGMGLVEVRTLSGDIGLSDEGAAVCAELAGPAVAGDPGGGCLGNEPIMTDSDRAIAEQMTGQLKFLAGDKSWTFDALTDLMADLKTIESQLLSSRPKTAIIKECFRSIHTLLSDAGLSEIAGDVAGVLGE